MKVVNFMNFVRQCDPRTEGSEQMLFNTTAREVALVNEYGIDNTFLLQYDAIIDPRFQKLFKEQCDAKTELGVWLEIVKPLLDKVGLPWRGKEGWGWDWHIVPGFSMAYTNEQREMLIDEVMHKFKEVFGYYPKSVGSWLIDSHTVEYLAKNYDISAFCICRDEIETDAYTLVGGYFNQGYYPSKVNMFTPAQTDEYRINVPVFRLLGPDPIHDYDNAKYLYDDNYKIYPPDKKYEGCYTLEPVWPTGQIPETVDWFFETYFKNEDLGFSYAQLGQENSFGYTDFIPALRMQLDKLKDYPEVKFMKMCDTGEAFKKLYPNKTPATAITALSDWNRGEDIQSVYYDCQNYQANLFRCKNKIFIRSMYLFDERIPEWYLDTPCETWDATYENMPVVETLLGKDDNGLVLDNNGVSLTVNKPQEGVLEVLWQDKKVKFTENGIEFFGITPTLNSDGGPYAARVMKDGIYYDYKGNKYALIANGGAEGDTALAKFPIKDGSVKLTFKRL